jgi:L-lactate dehydrogenase complex protein LldG
MISAPGRSRLASLLPPVHLAIVRRDQLVYSVAEFFATQAASFCNRASCTFITGPSRTGDIELTLTKGIHGPGKVLVVVGP